MYRDLNEDLAAEGLPAIQHTFDIWHMIKVYGNKYFFFNLENMFNELILSSACIKRHFQRFEIEDLPVAAGVASVHRQYTVVELPALQW